MSSDIPMIPDNVPFSENESNALFEIKCALRDLSVLAKMIDESLSKLTMSMHSLARRKRVKITVKDFQVQNLDAITLSFS